jgi:predicted RNA-binding Zn-ribbon protein involved in translation (DUF1610 family)
VDAAAEPAMTTSPPTSAVADRKVESKVAVTLDYKRIARCSHVVSLIVTAPVYVLLLFLLVTLGAIIPMSIWNLPEFIWTLMSTILLLLEILIAFFCVRPVYRLLRWRTIYDPENRYCGSCGYDLTGNVSGVCPECGEAISCTARQTNAQRPGQIG